MKNIDKIEKYVILSVIKKYYLNFAIMNKFEILDKNMLDRGCLEKILERRIETSGDVFPHLRIGWYMFANGKFSPYPDTFSEPIGVVAWLKPDLDAKAGERGLIILFDEYYGEWSRHNLIFCANEPSDGARNTQIMLKKVKSLKISIPVAEFCEKVNGKINGVNAFIPAYKQLDKIASSYSTIRDAFQAVGKTFHPFLFSSTEVGVKHVICMDMTTAAVLKRVKGNLAHMYPVITF